MQKPINRKNRNYPKDFNISPTNNSRKITKQYTFNKQPSISDSLDHYDDRMPHSRTPFQESKQANYEEQHQFKVMKNNMQNTKNNLQQPKQEYQQPKHIQQFQNIPYDSNKEYQLDLNYEHQLQKKQIDHQNIKNKIAHDLINSQKWKSEPHSEPTPSRYQQQKKEVQNVLPLLTPRKQSFDQGIPKHSGFIKRQSLNFHNQPLYGNSKSFVQVNVNPQYSPQKTFNKMALSLLGVKRPKANRSCQSTSFWEKPDKKRNTRYGISQKKDTEIYEHSLFPFKASSIQNLKVEIGQIVNNRRYKNNTPTLEEKNQKMQQNQTQDMLTQVDQSYYPELCVPNVKKSIKIDHKTSLSSLKTFLIHEINPKKIIIELPNFFLTPPQQFFKEGNFNQEQIHYQACYVFTNLGIPIVGITIRRYSNCLVIVNSNICIVWHDGNRGKRYFGSWKTKYFDEGIKEGMGLEWSPGKSVYYGQFKENKRHGFGVMKKSDGNVVVGYWKKGKAINFGIQKNWQ